MKNIGLFLIASLGFVLFFNACEKNDKEPKLMNATPAAILNPANGDAIVLTLADSANPFIVQWSAATYAISGESSLPMPTYSLQMAYADSNFRGSRELVNTQDLSYETIYYNLNNSLLLMGMAPDSTGDIEMRVMSEIIGASNTEAYSEAIRLTVTTFEPPTPVGPEKKVIYLIGNATSLVPEWTNTMVYAMTPVFKASGDYEDGIYATVDHLTPSEAGTDRFIKFISVIGNWAPQWGTDATGTSETGPLVYRPDETVPDPPAIPAPDVEGNYYIVADTINLTYETMLTSGELYLVGAATPAGWDNTLAIPFEQDPDTLTKFTLEVELTAGAGMKFLEVLGEWAPQYGSYEATAEGGVLSYRRTESIPDPPEIPSPESSGTYIIQVNLEQMSYKFIAQ